MHHLILYYGLAVCLGCGSLSQKQEAPLTQAPAPTVTNMPATVAQIGVPLGYTRLPQSSAGFGSYLQYLRLKKDKTVYLFNGQPKTNQQAQYAVLDISVGSKDLQQCADAVMRLRAEYLFSVKKFDQIKFHTGDGTWLVYTDWLKGTRYKFSGKKLVPVPGAVVPNTHEALLAYLDLVFAYCGTSTLPASLYSKPMPAMQPGDVLLKPGSPGHAVIVMAMAENGTGQKVYLLAQSYMPAQDIHVLKNPLNEESSPWYQLTNNNSIQTPEWTFNKDQLYGWK